MKRLVWILLVLSVVAQPMGSTGTYLLFQANQDYISQYLCEQRQVPNSDCQGSCYLKKQLQKQERQAPVHQRQPLQDLFFVANGVKLKEVYLVAEAPTKGTAYTIEVYPSPVFHIFHPPRFLA